VLKSVVRKARAKPVLSGWATEADEIVEKLYNDFNEEHGTDIKFK